MAVLSILGVGFLVQIIAQLLVLITNGFLGFAGAVLSWVCSGNFINLPYTSGPVVETSWALVRDLTNMMFIVVLVFIGLATALRIREYEARKTLPVLILIGILINFTPVICGFIVDASNIVMNFFLTKVTGGEVLGAQLYQHFNAIKGELFSINAFNPLEHLNILLRALTLVVFNVIAAFIFFAFAFIFVIRYVAIWVLVILSPLAFFSRILPATRKIWDMWWNQFMQWVFIGITGAFFLYLGMQTMIILAENQASLGGLGTQWTGLTSFLNDFIPYGIGMAFLLIGFFVGLSTGAMGGSQILSLAKTQGAAAGKAVGGWAGTRAKGWARERVPDSVRRLGDRMASAQAPWQGQRGLKGVVSSMASPFWAIGRGVGRGATGLRESERKGIDEMEKKMSGQSIEAQMAAFRGATTDVDRIGTLNAIIKDKNLPQAEARGLTEAEKARLYNVARDRYGKHKTIMAASLHLPDIKNSVTPVYNATAGRMETLGEAIGREVIRERMKKTEDWSNISAQALNDDDVMEGILKNATGGQLGQILENHQQDGIDAVRRHVRRLAAREGFAGRERDWINSGTRLRQYFVTGAGARNYGISF